MLKKTNDKYSNINENIVRGNVCTHVSQGYQLFSPGSKKFSPQVWENQSKKLGMGMSLGEPIKKFGHVMFGLDTQGNTVR